MDNQPLKSLTIKLRQGVSAHITEEKIYEINEYVSSPNMEIEEVINKVRKLGE